LHGEICKKSIRKNMTRKSKNSIRKSGKKPLENTLNTKKKLLNLLNGEYPLELLLSEQKGKLRKLLESTLQTGESNSVLVIGKSGSGKSSLVNGILEDFKGNSNSSNFYIIELNGNVLSDDKMAIKEIIRQLAVNISLEEEGEENVLQSTVSQYLSSYKKK
jgi:Cdc6-like AAA superfamily ATPase